jgi:serine/threonine-protein kinase
MARVYLARDAVSTQMRHVAIKVLTDARDVDVQMLRHEARIIAQLQHMHIAALLDAGEAPDGMHYLVMEYVHGVSLRQVLEAARAAGRWLPPGFGISVVAAAAAALHHAHERVGAEGPLGIVHRDVAPSNIMIGFDGQVKLIDFGIAWSRVRDHETKRGLVKGKVGYMSPEQILGHVVDRRSDIFSLGVVAYEATAQARAFRAASEHETARRVINGAVRPPSAARPGYPPMLAHLVMTALSVDPARRYQDAEEMGRACVRVAGRIGAKMGQSAIADVMADLFPDQVRQRSARGTGANELVLDLRIDEDESESEAATTTRFRPVTGEPSVIVTLDDA